MGIDVARLAQLIRTKREKEDLTLRDVQTATGLPIPTISRLEHAQSKDVGGSTLVPIAHWLGCSMDELQVGIPEYPTQQGKPIDTTPDVVDIYLRADKNLDRNTAEALSIMFRTAYEAFASHRLARK
jgi:transcriptional regulator with XRE-family HTH domain